MKTISSWGRLSKDDHDVIVLSSQTKALELINRKNSGQGLAYGMGRSYGDVGLNSGGALWLTANLNHFIEFDEETGVLTCESGVLLGDIQKLFIPRGWMLPVTPGTQMVTVGGAIANDVHGKNHYLLGSFGNHVRKIKLARTDGTELECSALTNSEWFSSTIGGLGLTGVIIEAQIQLQRVDGPWLATETTSHSNLSEFFELVNQSEKDWEHTVSWIDCTSHNGRGIFMRANPLRCQKNYKIHKNRRILRPPSISLVNSLTVKLFNLAYYNLKKYSTDKGTIDYESFFYPLDKIFEWNRMYGPKGFFQYQSVVPRDVGHDATLAMLREIKNSGQGSFLGVLKTFGDIQPLGMLSFPKAGVTLALDFPNRESGTHKLFNRLDAIVKEANGRIYPAKDARMPRELFEAGYPRFNEFLKYRDVGISSSLSRRLMGG